MKIWKFVLLVFCVLLSACTYGYRQKVENYNRNLCMRDFKEDVYPFNLKAKAIIDDGYLVLFMENVSSETVPVVGPYFYGAGLELFSNNDENIEWCATGVIDFYGSSYFVDEKGYKSELINESDFDKSLKNIKNGEYKTRFRIAGTATNWCQVKVTDGKVSSLKCPEDNK